MRNLFKLILVVLTLGLILGLALSAAGAETAEPLQPEKTITTEDERILEDDVFAKIEAVKAEAVRASGCGQLTEAGYASLTPQVILAIEASETYVPGTLRQNGSFLVWETTVGLPCCYDPKMEARLASVPSGSLPAADSRTFPDEDPVRGGIPSSRSVGLIQPFWESASNNADPHFNDYSPRYLEVWTNVNTFMQTTGLRYTMGNATINNVAAAMETCGIVIFDSHGNTDYTGSNGDYTSRANCSYLCLTTSAGITSADTKPQSGPYGTYYHAVKGSSYTMVSGTCIANHMKSDAPHSLLYNGICLGMATDGIYKSLRAKGVEVVWGYSQSVTFKGDYCYMASILQNVWLGDSFSAAVSKAKAEWGDWDPAYPHLTLEQCVQQHVAFPICVSSEDAYPGRGNLDRVQTVKSTWAFYNASFAVTGTCGDNAVWALYPLTGRLSITGTGAIYDYAYNNWSFYKNLIKTVSIGDGITTVGNHDFTDSPLLTSVTFGSTVNVIAGYAFQNCTGLKSVRIPGSVESISSHAFDGCTGITDLTLDNGVKNINDYAFSGCTGLTKVSFPDSIRIIGANSFFKCRALERVVVGSGITAFKSGAFSNCDALKRVDVSDLVGWCKSTFADVGANPLCQNGQLYLNGTLVTRLAIPDGISAVTANAFSCCKSITSVCIPDSVTVIDDYAFYFCTALAEVEMGSGVNRIGVCAFQYCSSLTAFDMGPSVTSIDSLAFDSCTSLTCISFSPSLQSIGLRAFTYCSELTEVRLGPNVESIGSYAFADCKKMKSICLPASLTALGSNALYETFQLKDLYFAGSKPALDALLETYDSESTHLPDSLRRHYDAEAPETHWLQQPDSQEQTCTADGMYHYSCACGYEKTEIVPAAHIWDEGVVAQPPSAAENGILLFTCLRCGETRTEEIPNNPFVDVKEGKYYYEAVLWAYYRDPRITSGTDETHFSPNQKCTRAQVVTFLWNALGKQEPDPDSNPFVDVPDGKFYSKAVLWAWQSGIAAGVDETHFGPKGDCSRAQVVTFLWRAQGEPEPTVTETAFTDLQADKYYYRAVLWAVENGITSGTDETHFSPNAVCTRGQVVSFLYRTLEPGETPED